jgi:hypothetical protein
MNQPFPSDTNQSGFTSGYTPRKTKANNQLSSLKWMEQQCSITQERVV